MSNDFWSNGYWAEGYFPDGYFGVDEAAPEGAMVASLSGSASVTAIAGYVANLAANLQGSSELQSGLTAQQVAPPQSVGGSYYGGYVSPIPERQVIIADMAAQIGGSSAITARSTASASMSADIEAGCVVSAELKSVSWVAQDNAFWFMAA